MGSEAESRWVATIVFRGPHQLDEQDVGSILKQLAAPGGVVTPGKAAGGMVVLGFSEPSRPVAWRRAVTQVLAIEAALSARHGAELWGRLFLQLSLRNSADGPDGWADAGEP